jgi:hypothetical protein
MAFAAGADFLVTGDKPLLRVQQVGRARIVTPRRFAAMAACAMKRMHDCRQNCICLVVGIGNGALQRRGH